MGLALAAAAARRGADVALIAANVSLPEPAGVRRIDVETADQLAEAARSEFPAAHVLLMTAAPADFRASEPAAGKLKRQGALDLHLEPTEDILAGLTASRTDQQTIVGFAAEHGATRAAPGERKADAQGRRPNRPERRFRPNHRLREPRQRRNPDRLHERDQPFPQAPKDTIAEQASSTG